MNDSPNQDDAHSRLREHIAGRLAVAQAVCREPKGIVWRTGRDRYDGSRYHLHEVMGPDLTDPMGSMMVDPEVAAYIELHNTADAVRRYERELRVLGRHTPEHRPGFPDACEGCGYTGDLDEPRYGIDECPDLNDLFDVYPEVAR